MTLSKVGQLEAEFLKAKEAFQSPELGVLFSKAFLGLPVTVTPPQVCPPETRETAEGTFHDGSRMGRP